MQYARLERSWPDTCRLGPAQEGSPPRPRRCSGSSGAAGTRQGLEGAQPGSRGRRSETRPRPGVGPSSFSLRSRRRAHRLGPFDRRASRGVDSGARPPAEVGNRGGNVASKKALITGITGQDGSYLAELLLEKGYEVHGLVRRSSSFNTWRIDHVRDQLVLHYGDLVDQNSLARALEALQPDEVYNLAAQSHVKVSFDMPEYTTDVTALGVLRVLDAVRDLGLHSPRLPGGQLRDVRPRAGDPADREDALLPPLALRGLQGLRPLDVRELPRELRDARLQRHPLQPRVAPARRELRHPQDHHGGGRHQAGTRQGAAARQPRRQARLGLREGLRRGHVAHAAAGEAGRLRDRDRRDPLGPGVLRGGLLLRRASTGRTS